MPDGLSYGFAFWNTLKFIVVRLENTGLRDGLTVRRRFVYVRAKVDHLSELDIVQPQEERAVFLVLETQGQ